MARLEPATSPAAAPLRALSPLQPPAVAERASLPLAPTLAIERLIVEVTPAPQAPPAPAPVIVQRSAPAAAPAQSSILRRGFGLGQS